MKKSFSPLLAFAALAMSVSRKHLASYSCAKSKHDYTQAQLMACVLLKMYLKQDYRGICDVLANSDKLCQQLGLTRVPHYTTVQKFAQRIADPALIDGLLATVLERFAKDGEPVAMDSTGMDPRVASVHFRDKTGRKNAGYVKVSVIVGCLSFLPVSLAVTWGPRNDLAEAPQLLAKAFTRVRPATLYADKGYDAEWVHRWCQTRWLVRSVIGTVVKSADGSIKTPLRRQMLPLPRDRGRRWAIETFFSALKRTCGDRLTARSRPAQFTEAALRVLTYALRR
jgi:hypothetical protein